METSYLYRRLWICCVSLEDFNNDGSSWRVHFYKEVLERVFSLEKVLSIWKTLSRSLQKKISWKSLLYTKYLENLWSQINLLYIKKLENNEKGLPLQKRYSLYRRPWKALVSSSVSKILSKVYSLKKNLFSHWKTLKSSSTWNILKTFSVYRSPSLYRNPSFSRRYPKYPLTIENLQKVLCL